jgi:hypothetical protein
MNESGLSGRQVQRSNVCIHVKCRHAVAQFEFFQALLRTKFEVASPLFWFMMLLAILVAL